LLGGQIAPGWHGGFNAVYEQEIAGELEREWIASAGVSRTIVDEQFHVGAEGYAEFHDVKGERFKFGDQERLFLGGPSFLLQPVHPMHILVTPMIGRGAGAGESMRNMMRLWFVAGWTF
jgi:hypothetical protein